MDHASRNQEEKGKANKKNNCLFEGFVKLPEDVIAQPQMGYPGHKLDGNKSNHVKV